MDNYIYKMLENIGDGIQWVADFLDTYNKEVKWFVIGIACVLLIQFII